jgi:hypothetical protein
MKFLSRNAPTPTPNQLSCLEPGDYLYSRVLIRNHYVNLFTKYPHKIKKRDYVNPNMEFILAMRMQCKEMLQVEEESEKSDPP